MTPKQIEALRAALEAQRNAMRYYDLKRHWTKRIVPHLGDAELNRVLVRDFNRFTSGRWGKPFLAGMFPEEFESCDWRLYRPTPHPRYWRYVKHAACHWIVNFALRLATLTEPNRPWRIVSSIKHSTVWDGRHCLFDINFPPFDVPAAECWQLAATNGHRYAPGQFTRPGRPRPLAEHSDLRTAPQ